MGMHMHMVEEERDIKICGAVFIADVFSRALFSRAPTVRAPHTAAEAASDIMCSCCITSNMILRKGVLVYQKRTVPC